MTSWRNVLPERERAIYEKGGHGKRQAFGQNPALLVIDVTYGFIGQKPADVLQSVEEFATSCGDVGWAALPNIKNLLSVCREKQRPVVYTRGNLATKRFLGGAARLGPQPDVQDEDAWNSEMQRRGQEIPDLIAPLPGEWVLEKSRASAFFSTPLAIYLRQQGVDTVLLTGCVTSGCVRATAVDACSHGFHTFVVEEGVFDRAEMSHLVSLYEMNAKYATVITLAEAIEYVSGQE